VERTVAGLSDRIVESGLRTATAITALAGTLTEVKRLLVICVTGHRGRVCVVTAFIVAHAGAALGAAATLHFMRWLGDRTRGTWRTWWGALSGYCAGLVSCWLALVLAQGSGAEVVVLALLGPALSSGVVAGYALCGGSL
jgi:hypothetical protein